MSSIPKEQTNLDDAREQVLAWLREPHRNARFLQEQGEAALQGRHGEIVERFLSWVREAGFEVEMVNTGTEDCPAYEAQWRIRGCVLVGFRQPAAVPLPDDAKLLSCAALLRNDWCRNRLP